MKEELLKLIEEKSPGAQPLYLVIRGSQAYGTSIPTSDTDFGGVFIQSIDDIFGFKYKEQINDDKNDLVLYELKRFLELCSANNPNILEILNTPPECILYKHPVFDLILENRDQFITKICANSFGGYARSQIGKAKGHIESEIKEVYTLFKESNLPEKVGENFINSLLVKIRKSVYGIQ